MSEIGFVTQFPDEVVEPYTRLAARALGAPVAAFFIRRGDTLVLRCGTGLPDTLNSRRELPYFLGVNSPPRILIDDVSASPLTRDSAALEELAWKSLAVLQLGLDNGATALLCVADMHTRAWTQRDSDLLTEIAGITVIQIRHELRTRDESSR